MKRHGKYNAKKTELNGIMFDSKGEANRYHELRTLEQIGEVRYLKLQVKFPLMCGDNEIRIKSDPKHKGRAVSYVADFTYEQWLGVDRGWVYIVEDYKGFDTPMGRLKRAILLADKGISVLVTH